MCGYHFLLNYYLLKSFKGGKKFKTPCIRKALRFKIPNGTKDTNQPHILMKKVLDSYIFGEHGKGGGCWGKCAVIREPGGSICINKGRCPATPQPHVYAFKTMA